MEWQLGGLRRKEFGFKEVYDVGLCDAAAPLHGYIGLLLVERHMRTGLRL